MTLYRQLLIGIIVLLAAIFIGSVVISSKSAQRSTNNVASDVVQN